MKGEQVKYSIKRQQILLFDQTVMLDIFVIIFIHFTGARVILACRDPRRAEDARRDLAREGGAVETRQLDLSSLKSVRNFADGIKKDKIKLVKDIKYENKLVNYIKNKTKLVIDIKYEKNKKLYKKRVSIHVDFQ